MRSIAEIFRSYGVLDAQGKHVNGTDKETNHRYGDAYEQLFRTNDYWSYGSQPPRLGVRMVMEVGVADGSSLLAWSEVFPHAWVVGLDIHPAVRAVHAPHVEFVLGDATRKEDCDRTAGGRQFDLIVEDATHVLGDTLATLLYLWPYVRPGGMYVIEEFANVGALCANIQVLWPFAEIVDTVGPFGGIEPLVVLRKAQ